MHHSPVISSWKPVALGLPRTALRHRVVSRFCRVQESLPCQALGVCGRHATVCHHDRHPLGPALAECLRHGERWASRCEAQPPPPAPPPPRPRSHPYTPRTRLAPALLPACPVAPPGERVGATAAARPHRYRGRRRTRAPPAPSPSASPARQKSRRRATRLQPAAPAHQRPPRTPTAAPPQLAARQR